MREEAPSVCTCETWFSWFQYNMLIFECSNVIDFSGFNQPMMPTASQMGANQMPPPYGSQGTSKIQHGQQPASAHTQSAPGGSQIFPGMAGSYSGGGGPIGFGPNMSQMNQQGDTKDFTDRNQICAQQKKKDYCLNQNPAFVLCRSQY